MTIQEDCRLVAEDFAAAIINSDLPRAYSLLAPWVQAQMPEGALLQSIQSMISEVATARQCPEPHWPIDYRLDVQNLSLTNLRGCGDRQIPEEVTPSNYRCWMAIQFVADEATGLDAWFDFWCLVVQLPEGYRIGYFEMVEVE
jgi:hypothetical protein